MKYKIAIGILVFILSLVITTSMGPRALANQVIVIDPGHGGIYPGAIANGVREADVNLAVALKLRDKLVLSGATVIMTRTTDKNLAPPGSSLKADLQERVNVAKASGGDIFISLHANSSQDANSIGAISFFPIGGSDSLARAIQNSLSKRIVISNNGVRPADFYVLVHSNIPSALIEMGFLTNPKEATLLTNSSYQNRLADSIYEGIVNYFYAGNTTFNSFNYQLSST